MHEPFIKIHKKITDWGWYTDVNTSKLFIHLLIRCNYADGMWMGIEIKRGQTVTSVQKLSNETGLSIQSVRTSLGKLESTGDITSDATTKYTLIEIKNYNQYNDTNKPSNNRTTNKKQTANKPSTTIEEEKEVKKKENKDASKEVTDKSETPKVKKSYGNPEINEMLKAIKAICKLTDFSGPKTSHRRSGKHLVDLRNKIGQDEFTRRLKVFLSNKWHASKCGDLSHLYNTLKSTPLGTPVGISTGVTRI